MPPRIENLPTATPVTVKEHEPAGVFVYRVVGNNRRTALPTVPPPLIYSINTTEFAIDSNTGTLYIIKVIQYSQTDVYCMLLYTHKNNIFYIAFSVVLRSYNNYYR